MHEHTREAELQYERLRIASHKAAIELLPYERARDNHLGKLGRILWDAPRDNGTMGLAYWASLNADVLIAMLEPFAKKGP